jgi:hypothetical protein
VDGLARGCHSQFSPSDLHSQLSSSGGGLPGRSGFERIPDACFIFCGIVAPPHSGPHRPSASRKELGFLAGQVSGWQTGNCLNTKMVIERQPSRPAGPDYHLSIVNFLHPEAEISVQTGRGPSPKGTAESADVLAPCSLRSAQCSRAILCQGRRHS